jgi:hypothetical protein
MAIINLGERLGLYDAGSTLALTNQLESAGDGPRVRSLLARLIPGVTGQQVRLVGLRSRPDLNGRCGRTGVVSAGRVAIRLDGERPMLFKADNVEPGASREQILEHAFSEYDHWRLSSLRGLGEAGAWAANPETEVDPRGGNVAVIRRVLSSADIHDLMGMARAWATASEADLARKGSPRCQESVPVLGKELGARAHDVRFSQQHIALYLHREGALQTQHPEICTRLLRAMCEQPALGAAEWCDAATPLQVRCVELHTYTVGGGLLQANHRDHGSVLTMSVLLSEADQLSGGQFVTWEGGQAVAHALGQGDAVLLHSCRAHNVAQVTRGIRESLVIELWQGATNVFDRES